MRESREREAVESSDAIVVVSGGDTNARTNEAIKLYREGWAPLIIVISSAAAGQIWPIQCKDYVSASN